MSNSVGDEFRKAMNEIVDYRGGKLRVPGPPECGYTYYVNKVSYEDAREAGYIDDNSKVTEKFRAEYADMFDKIGMIL